MAFFLIDKQVNNSKTSFKLIRSNQLKKSKFAFYNNTPKTIE